MRISRATLLVLIALIVVIAVELRTVLGFFDVAVSIPAVLAAAGVAVVVLVLWAVFTNGDTRGPG